MYIRHLEKKALQILDSKSILVLYGARQVGKTTLVKELMKSEDKSIYLACDDPSVRGQLENKSANELKSLVGNNKLIVLDEAQKIENIGTTVKIFFDKFPDIKIILTGSSSLDLANKVNEPLTGRAKQLLLFPLSIDEVSENNFEKNSNFRTMLLRGGYPKIWTESQLDAYDSLQQLATNYVYKDVFASGVRIDDKFVLELLQLLAHQIGNEVNYNELGRNLEVSKDTVKRYIDLLEKAFIIFRLGQFKTNMRNEVGRLRKIYFYDLGLRNALVNNFNTLDNRNDIGALWENFCIVERKKFLQQQNRFVNMYYWRDRNKNEVDLIEVEGELVSAFEFKYSKLKHRTPLAFDRQNPGVPLKFITYENIFTEYLSS